MLQTLEEIHVRPKTGMQSKAPFLIGPNLMDSMYFMLLLITIKITNTQEDAAAWVLSLSLSLFFLSSVHLLILLQSHFYGRRRRVIMGKERVVP